MMYGAPQNLGIKGEMAFGVGSGKAVGSVKFIEASGLPDFNDKFAITTLVTNLNTFFLWTKYKAIYPMVGGTEALHKWNLKDPQDTDGAFRLVFSGTWAHSSSGAEPNGTTGYANTFLIPNTSLTLNSIAIQFYTPENASIAGYEIGGKGSSGTSFLAIIVKHTNANSYGNLNTGDASYGNIVADTRGLFTTSRTASNATAFYKNSTSLATTGTASSTLSTAVIYLGALNNNGTVQFYSGRLCSGAAISDGLTSGEVTSSYNAWQAYQTTLNRQF